MYHKRKSLNQAAEFLERSLEMLRIVHARNSMHRDIMELLSDLADVYEDQGQQHEALAINKRNNATNKARNGDAQSLIGGN